MNRWDLRLVLRGATCLLSLTTLAGCLQSHEIGVVYDDGVVPVASALECDATALPYGGGLGTEDDRYRICSGAQLRRIFEEPDAHFVLATDIVLGPHHWSPIEELHGSIDGAGHVVSELQIFRPQFRTAFVLTLYGSIRNIAFESVLVEGEAASAIVYRAREGSIIEGVRVRGEVTGHGATAGVIGLLEFGASATDVAFEGNVTSHGAGEAVGGGEHRERRHMIVFDV